MKKMFAKVFAKIKIAKTESPFNALNTPQQQ
jgi:hypothetical protein